LALLKGGVLPPERGYAMVTYAELFQFVLVLIGVIALVHQVCKGK